MSYDYEYDRMVEDSDDLYDLYTESDTEHDNQDDYDDGYNHSQKEYQDYYFNVTKDLDEDE